jgi:hypothetical protein
MGFTLPRRRIRFPATKSALVNLSETAARLPESGIFLGIAGRT